MLSQQEICEAEKLLDLWRNFGKQESEYPNVLGNAEERLTQCYGKTKNSVAAARKQLQILIGFIKTTIAEGVSFEAQITARCITYGLQRGSGDPPLWFKDLATVSKSKIMAAANRITNDENFPLLEIMVRSMDLDNIPVIDMLPILKRWETKLDTAEALWRQTQKEVRELLMDSGASFKGLRSNIFSLATAWAQASVERRDYLCKNGLCIPLPVQAGAVSNNGHCKPVRPLRNGKPKPQDVPAPAPKPETKNPSQETWNFSFLNPGTETILTSLDLLMTGNGDEITLILNENYGWPLDGERTLAKLRRLVDTPADKRPRLCSFRLSGQNWYRLKLGKYRMLAHINDSRREIRLMAGHRTDLYAAIGRKKNES